MHEEHRHPAEVHRVIDGDSIIFDLHLDYGITYEIYLRLLEIDTAETYNVSESSAEYKRGKQHEQFVKSWLSNAESLEVRTDEKDRVGRWLGEVFNQDGESLNDVLLEEFDVEYKQ